MNVMTVLQEVPMENEDPILADLRERIKLLREQERGLQAQLSEVGSVIKRYERAIKVLQDEPKAQATPKKRIRTDNTRIGPERLDRIREAVLQYGQAHEEFRQVDIRALVDINSSASAVAFEQLRQENVIRFARKDGNSKWYRLTREVLNAAT